MAEQYRFPRPLQEGVIHSRPNRFIMLATVAGEERKLHCPATGSIGGLKFRETPCLVALSDDKERSTRGTVEAISLDPPSAQKKHWVGIDQMRANDYVDFYLRRSLLKKMTGEVHQVQREVRVEGSRLDFLLNDNMYLEVKTPLHQLDPNWTEHRITGELTSFGRTMRHFGSVGAHAAAGRGILLMCFLYDARRFRVPKTTERNAVIKEAANAATRQGMESWQANFEIDHMGVRLLDLFPLDLLSLEEL